MVNGYHTPVLVEEALGFLLTRPDGVYIDATVGGGGHAEEILGRTSPTGQLIGFDVDADAIAHSAQRLEVFAGRCVLLRANYSELRKQLSRMNIAAVDGILFDLGVSSFQLDDPQKGFSFRGNELLDMRMDNRQKLDARRLLAEASERELERIFREYGEDPSARRIAKAIKANQTRRPVENSGEFVSVVGPVVGNRPKSLARVFQALRIAVNNELENLRDALSQAIELVSVGGRIVVISYHSLEDRIVKDFFKGEAQTRIPSGTKLVPDKERVARVRILTKKPIVPSAEEVRRNRRSRSAKLRAGERVS